jgi:hypothetical protein
MGALALNTGVREYKWLYSEHTDTRYSDKVTFVTDYLESTGVREYKWFYFELTDTRYLLFTQRNFIMSELALHRGQRVQVVVLRADRY